MSATLGGTAVALGGGKPARRSRSAGKFLNGAVTGAYVMMLNHMMHFTQDLPKTSENTLRFLMLLQPQLQ